MRTAVLRKLILALSLLLCAFAAFRAMPSLLSVVPAFAQESEAEDRSYFLGLVEDKLSGPNRIIRISGIQGVLSSNATIGSITIADKQGVWLKITNARIVWTRSALLLGRLSIDTLAADAIEVTRKPAPDPDALPSAESTSFQLPDLPLSITLDKLDVPRVSFAQSVFGLQSELAITGRLALDDGALDTALEVKRLDGPGGQLTLAAAYANADENLKLDLKLSEPQNGVVANLLNIENRPPVALALQGAGPLSRLDLNLSLDTDNSRALSGTAQVRRDAAGYGFTTALNGDIARLLAAPYRPFFGPQTTLNAEGQFKAGGGFLLQSLALDGGALDVNAAAETSADGFLRRLGLYAYLGTRDAQVTVLPVPGGQTTVDSAELKLSFGETEAAKWTGSLVVQKLSTAQFAADKVEIGMGGAAENLDNPAARHISFSIAGPVTGIVPTRADVAEALGDRLDLDVNGDWRTGQPVILNKAALTGNGLAASLAGQIAQATFTGNISVDAASIAPFSALAGRDLDGSLRLDADGSVSPVGGGFDLALNGSSTGLELDSPALDRLLSGETRITGRVARSAEGLRAERLRLENPQATINADGTFATGTADFNFDLALSDLALLSSQASGRLSASGRAKGQEGVIGVTLKADLPQGTLVRKTLADATLGFDGTLKGGDIEGRVTGQAQLDQVPVALATNVATSASARRLSDLAFNAGPTAITGSVTQELPSGLLAGNLKLASPDISTLAALALQQASGAANADITLSHPDAKQSADINASVTDLVIGGARVGRAQVQAAAADLFGVPVVNGTASGANIVAGGVTVQTLEAKANATGNRTEFSADALLANAATVSAAGALEPEQAGGFRLELQRAELAQGALQARLAEPGLLRVQGSDVAIDNLALDVGGGRVRAAGTFAEALNLSAEIENLPLRIANAVKPDLQLGGIVNGTAKVTGARKVPVIDFDLAANDVAAAALKRAGLSTVNVKATGRTAENRLDLNAAVTSPEGLNATAKGAVPLAGGELALDVNLQNFPLGVLNTVVPNQNLSGTVAGTARVTGTLQKPAAAFDVTGRGLRAAALSRAGLSDLSLQAKGDASAERVNIDASASSPQGLRATAKGSVPLNNQPIALDVGLTSFPLAVLNEAVPNQNLSGSVTGTAKISGMLREPAADFDIRGQNLGAAPLTRAGLSNLAVQAQGKTEGRQLDINATVSSPQGLRVKANGAVPLNRTGRIDLAVGLDALPLSAANAAVPGQDFSGTVTGTAQISGTLAEPAANFDLRGERIGAAPLARAGLRDVAVQAKGQTEGRRLNIDTTVTSPQGLRITAQGAVPLNRTERIDLNITLAALPLSAANAAAPGQEFSGTVAGTAKIAGTLSEPSADFDLRGERIGAAPLTKAGLRDLSVQARGRTEGRRLNIDTSVSSPQGLRISANGAVPLDRTGQLDVNLALAAFPLGALNAAIPGQDLAGTVSGNARVTGALTNPSADFSLQGRGISASALARAGAAPVSLDVSGRYADRVLALGSARASGPGGIAVSASGRAPLSGSGANIRVDGSVPLSLANRFLAERGAQASGTVGLDIAITGSLTQPVLRGSFSTSGAALVDPQSNLRVSNIAIAGSLDGERVVISSATANVGGGSLAASGSVGIRGGSDFPADIRVNLNNVRYADGNLVVATVSGALAVTGPLTRGPLLSGSVEVVRAEISVPERLGGAASQLNVKHRNPPPGVAATLKRARASDGTPVPTARPSVLRLDVAVNAPARIFVRGRGLDAELGGSVKLTGSLTDIQPVGAFNLIRGRIGILGQRITFDEGEVTLVGDLDPYLNFTARSEGDDITVFVNVRGRVSDLQITFSSQPGLPQDEVLARLIFNRSINELSAFQIAQLASAAAELAGGSNNSLVGSLRKSTGLDDLDVVTDSQGNAAVRAGRYIQDNVYLGLEAGAGGSTRATINLDITKDLKARGAVGTNDQSLGVFYEKDY